jgi:hypothetical protein
MEIVGAAHSNWMGLTTTGSNFRQIASRRRAKPKQMLKLQDRKISHMRKLFWRVAIGSITFFLGILATGVVLDSWTVPTDAVLVIEPVYKPQIGIPRFAPTGRGCGNGYVQGYVTDDGQRVDEGVEAPFHKSARQEFLKYVHDATQVIQRLPKYHDHHGNVGERVIIVNKPDKEGRVWVSILFYDGGDHVRYIDAPNVALVLEFEQYLISEDLKLKD